MKHSFYFTIITTVLLVLSTAAVTAQKDIQIKAVQASDGIRLRWSPHDYKQMEYTKTQGYILKRTVIEDIEGNPITEDMGYDVMEYIVLPYDESTWEAQAQISPGKRAAVQELAKEKDIHIDETTVIKADTLTETKLYHAYMNTQTKENQYFYTLLMADQDFEIALGLGLGFIDNEGLINGFKYRYYITPHDIEEYIAVYGSVQGGFVDIVYADGADLLAPTLLDSEAGDKKAKIYWDATNIDGIYTYFNVYRSDDDGSSYQKKNEDPYIFFSQDNKYDRISFDDILPANGVSYFYKVAGISPFGGEGPLSNAIEVVGVPDPLPLSIEVTSIVDSASVLYFFWNVVSKIDSLPPPDSVLNQIVNFNIVYTPNLEDEHQLVKSNTDYTTRVESLTTWQDGYYFVVGMDVNGYQYTSIPYLAQAIDSIPPAVPTGLTARLNLDGTVRLTWEANTEEDLQGYRIFKRYSQSPDHVQVTSTPVKGTTYITKNESRNVHDTIFYAIAAADQRDNLSGLSADVLLVLPDRTPPSQPVLAQVLPRPEGIRIAWNLAKDADVSHHLLQRKKLKATQWTTLANIDSPEKFPLLPKTEEEIMPSNFVDIDTLQLRKYVYRIVAYDQSGLYTPSDEVTVKPFDDGIRGDIMIMKATLVPENQPYVANPDALLQGGGTASVLTNTNIGIHHQGYVKGSVISEGNVAQLHWEYDTKHPTTLQDFSIYQKIVDPTGINPYAPTAAHSSHFVLISTIDHRKASLIAQANGNTGYMLYVEDIQPEKFMPLVPAAPKPGSGPGSGVGSGTSQPVSPFEYRVIANHRDGGWSNKGEALLVKPF